MTTAYLLVLPNVHMLDLGGPLQIFSCVAELGLAPLRVRCAGPHSSVTSFQGPALGRSNGCLRDWNRAMWCWRSAANFWTH
ncbi:hypothetical protein [Cupriavidus oxalaticus]|uniref:hypothetical protein n=1 Tax=Cupriavidus oxalaticus TaxID=96344 RepID=UPI0026D9DFAD